MTATAPATPAVLAARAGVLAAARAARASAPRLAFTTATGDAPRPARAAAPAGDLWDTYGPYCFVCSRATDHFGEHDDLVESGQATYGRDGSVYRSAA